MPTAHVKPASVRFTEPFIHYKSQTTCQDPLPRAIPDSSAGISFGAPSRTRRYEEETGRNRVIVLTDTPNLFRSTRECFGEEYCPDYAELLSIARSRGDLVSAFALVNDGLPRHHMAALQRRGYGVLLSEGRDCDFRFVDQAIAMHRQGDTFFLCSGDHRFADLASVLRGIQKYVIVSALQSSCSRSLKRSADEFFPFPVKQKPPIAQERSLGPVRQ